MNSFNFKNLLLIVCVLAYTNSLTACTANGGPAKAKPICEEWIMPDSVAYSNLGKKVTDILMNANKVCVYSLAPKEKTTPDDVVILPNFVRDSLLATLSKEQATVLRYSLISLGENYQIDTEYVIRSPFLPVLEFEFTKKKKVAHVFVSLSDFKWGVVYDDKTMFKFNYASDIFVRRFCNFFLDKKNKRQ